MAAADVEEAFQSVWSARPMVEARLAGLVPDVDILMETVSRGAERSPRMQKELGIGQCRQQDQKAEDAHLRTAEAPSRSHVQ